MKKDNMMQGTPSKGGHFSWYSWLLATWLGAIPFGLSIGLAQSWLLRKWGRRLPWWSFTGALAGSVSAMIAGLVSTFGTGRCSYLLSLASGIIAASLALGTITGPVMVQMIRT